MEKENNKIKFKDTPNSWSKEKYIAQNSEIPLEKKIILYRKFINIAYVLFFISFIFAIITIVSIYYKQHTKHNFLINKDGIVKEVDTSLDNALRLINNNLKK